MEVLQRSNKLCEQLQREREQCGGRFDAECSLFFGVAGAALSLVAVSDVEGSFEVGGGACFGVFV